MSVQGDTELRDLVSQTLENAGVLSKIRAELRASVFLVLEEHEAFKGRNLSFTNGPLKDFLSTQEGIIIVSLVREFLEYFGLEFSASVFEPETQAGKDYEYVGRTQLAHDLKLNSGKKAPLIAQVLQESKVCFPSAIHTQKGDLAESALKTEKIKDDKKIPEINSHLAKTEITGPANGLIKNTESPTKDGENKPLFSTPPQMMQIKKPDNLKLDLNQMNLKPSGSSLSSLGALPPLGLPQGNQTIKSTNNRSSKQVTSDIKALLDLGSESPENNYEEDFHASGSEKTSKGTNRSLSGSGSEIEEEMSVGMDEHTADLTSGSNGSGKTADL